MIPLGCADRALCVQTETFGRICEWVSLLLHSGESEAMRNSINLMCYNLLLKMIAGRWKDAAGKSTCHRSSACLRRPTTVSITAAYESQSKLEETDDKEVALILLIHQKFDMKKKCLHGLFLQLQMSILSCQARNNTADRKQTQKMGKYVSEQDCLWESCSVALLCMKGFWNWCLWIKKNARRL